MRAVHGTGDIVPSNRWFRSTKLGCRSAHSKGAVGRFNLARDLADSAGGKSSCARKRRCAWSSRKERALIEDCFLSLTACALQY